MNKGLFKDDKKSRIFKKIKLVINECDLQMKYLSAKIEFPNVAQSTEEGLLAIGGDLSPERLLLAYKMGIFPWYNNEEPILWWSPDPRFVLFPEKLKVSKSMNKILKSKKFKVTINEDFSSVINACSQSERDGQSGTWITDDMILAYVKLHELGYAKSVEVWQDEVLVAGLYGIDLNNGVFCGESMFTHLSNASKVGFINFILNSSYKIIDCQVYTSHLESLGAEDISRAAFLNFIS
jgi:leucyl/phenylalanyl-tRNA--protein transferase